MTFFTVKVYMEEYRSKNNILIIILWTNFEHGVLGSILLYQLCIKKLKVEMNSLIVIVVCSEIQVSIENSLTVYQNCISYCIVVHLPSHRASLLMPYKAYTYYYLLFLLFFLSLREHPKPLVPIFINVYDKLLLGYQCP